MWGVWNLWIRRLHWSAYVPLPHCAENGSIRVVVFIKQKNVSPIGNGAGTDKGTRNYFDCLSCWSRFHPHVPPSSPTLCDYPPIAQWLSWNHYMTGWGDPLAIVAFLPMVWGEKCAWKYPIFVRGPDIILTWYGPCGWCARLCGSPISDFLSPRSTDCRWPIKL